MPGPLEIEFTITEDDLVERVVHLTEGSPAVRSGRRFRKWLGAALVLLLAWPLAAGSGTWWAALAVVPAAIAFPFLLDRFSVISTRRFARRFIAEKRVTQAPGPRRLVLEGNSVRIEAPASVSTIRIEGPVRVEEDHGFAFVELGAGEALFIPLRPAAKGDPRAFVDALRSRATAGPGSPGV